MDVEDQGRPAPEDFLEAAELWKAALPEIRGAMTQGTFDTWLRHAQPLEYVEEPRRSPDGDPSGHGQFLTIGVPTPHAIGWLNHRLSAVVLRVLRTVTPSLAGVRFVVYHEGAPDASKLPARGPPRTLSRNTQPKPAADRPPEDLWRSGRPDTPTRDQVAREAADTVASPTGRYVKLKVAFRTSALGRLKGAPLSVFLCLALHVDRDGISSPGIGCIMRETDYSRPSVCKALDTLCSPALRLVEKLPDPDKLRGTDQYRLRGYAWFGTRPAPALFELD
jgi:hypothetical protein